MNIKVKKECIIVETEYGKIIPVSGSAFVSLFSDLHAFEKALRGCLEWCYNPPKNMAKVKTFSFKRFGKIKCGFHKNETREIFIQNGGGQVFTRDSVHIERLILAVDKLRRKYLA